MTYKFLNKIQAIKPLHDHVIVTEMNFKDRTLSSGIVLLGDDAKTAGIRPRWAQVYAVGPDQKDVAVGQWILVEHGRWTRGSEVEIDGEEMTIRRIDATAILMVSDESPNHDDNVSTAVQAESKTRDYS
jgi:co-chaperonin GroES (HSP10)